jgi:adenosylcobinamide kinase / adenosylcobinamide-phosphate guanylyltransferase
VAELRVPELIFVTGGARSGKSSFALARATALGGDAVSFIATAETLDAEMTDRVARHKLERNPHWETLEEPINILAALERASHEIVLLDCVSLWISNLLLSGLEEPAMLERTDVIIRSLQKTLIVVTNEVGFGIVPDNALARAYRDALGRVNARFAAASSEAHVLVSGLALRLK